MQLLTHIIRGFRIVRLLPAQSEWSAGVAVSVVTHASTWLVLSVVAQQYAAHVAVERGQNSVEISVQASAPSESTAAVATRLVLEATSDQAAEVAVSAKLRAAKLRAPMTAIDLAGEIAALDADPGEQVVGPPPVEREAVSDQEQKASDTADAAQPTVQRVASAASPTITTKAEIGAPFDTPPQAQPANEPPAYPREALEQGLSGTAILRVLICADGEVSDLSVERSSGVDMLDQAALHKVAQWRFVPASLLGVRVPAEVRVPIVFRLERAKGEESLESSKSPE